MDSEEEMGQWSEGAGLQRGLMWTEPEAPHGREEGMMRPIEV